MAESNDSKTRFFGSAAKAQVENVDPFGVAGAATDSFWENASSKELRLNWNKLFPFQLLVLKQADGGYTKESEFTLPIPPQELSIDTPFAINTTVTLGGILEEHNGAPLRMISLSGTTGVLPLRGFVARAETLGLGEAIFAGTLQGIQQVQTAVSQAGNLLGVASPRPNVISEEQFGTEGPGTVGDSTGYAQFLLLQRFLESYITRKKTAAGRDLRLGFAIWKEKAVYLVTPVNFGVRRSASSPLEYQYSLQFRAWKRISGLSGPPALDAHLAGTRDPNTMALVLNSLASARNVLAGALAAIRGVRADVDTVLMEPLRQTLMGLKDGLGVGLAAVDLPQSLITGLREPILELASFPGDIQGLKSGFATDHDERTRAYVEALAQLSLTSGKQANGSGRPSIGNNRNGANDNGGNPGTKIIKNPGKYNDLFKGIQVSRLNLRPQDVKAIAEERRRVSRLRRRDYEQFRDDALRVLADYSDSVGAGASTYTRVYGLPERTTTDEPTDSDWEIIHTLSQVAQQYDRLAVTGVSAEQPLSSMDYVAGLASRSGIAFTVARSKYGVPFPYGHTLEQLSNQYLGTPDRWHEIATLNGLRAPYVDEEGFTLPLLTNGIDSTIQVGPSTDLFVGQAIWLASSTVRREKRRIQKIEVLSPTQTLLTLDGDPDLGRFETAASAYLQAFLPDTVNSQMQVYIPSDREPAEDDFLTKDIPGVDYFDPMTKSGGIDLLLTPAGDLVFTPDGDNRLAVGLTNLIQKVRLAIGTPRGSLLHHPNYGLGLIPGTSTADLDAKTVLSGAKELFRGDPGISGVDAASVLKDGPLLQLRISVGITGTSKFIPIQVTVRR